MKRKRIRRTVQMCLLIVSTLCLTLMFPLEDSMIGNVSAGSTWVQTTEADFNLGTPNNVNITATGEVKLEEHQNFVMDDFTSHTWIDDEVNTTLDISPGELFINSTFGEAGTEMGRSVQQTSDGGYIIAGRKGIGFNYDAWLIKTDENGTEEWNKTFGGSSADYGVSVQQTSDNGYIITGQTFSFGAGNYDAWLIKTDSNGNEEWNNTYGGNAGDYGYSVQETFDGGFIIGASTYTYGAGDLDLWLIKTDSIGQEEWNKTFGTFEEEEGNSAIQTFDGGYAIVGYTVGGGANVAWLIKTNVTGDEEWNKTYGGTSNDNANSVKQTSDGGYIIGGYTNSFGAVLNDAWLIKTDIDGNEEWNETYGGDGTDIGYSAHETSDGGFFIAGYTDSFGSGSRDFWLVKTENNGDEIWNTTFGGGSSDVAYSAQQTIDNGFVIAGYSNSWSGNYDVWLIKINASMGAAKLRKLFKTYGGGSFDIGQSILMTPDKGYLIAGYTQSYGAGEYDGWLIKTDLYGNEEWNKTYGGAFTDLFYHINETSDGGYILTGSTASFGATFDNMWLVKIDAMGNEEWNRTFGGDGRENGKEVLQLGWGYIIVGTTESFGAPGTNAWLVRANDTGYEVWNYTYGGPNTDSGESLNQTSDGGYVIAGYTASYGAGSYNGWIIKTLSNGKEDWNKTFGSDQSDRLYSVREDSGGYYVIGGETQSWGSGNYDAWLIKIKTNGDEVWNFTYGGLQADLISSVDEASDGGYICSGRTASFTAGNYDLWLIKTSSSGVESWNRSIGDTNYDTSAMVKTSLRGGYEIVGSTRSFGSGGYDVWFIRTDDLGYVMFTHGELTSANLLAGQSASAFEELICVVSIPPATTMRIQFSNDSVNWYNMNGTINVWDGLSNGPNTFDLSSLGWNGSHFSYRVNFWSNEYYSPVLHMVEFIYRRYFEFGFLVSQRFDSGGPVSWDILEWNAIKPPDTDLRFQLRSATTMFGLWTKEFVGPDGGPDTFYGVPPSIIWPGHGNDERWIQYIAYFETFDGSRTPILEDVTIAYNRIPNPPQLVAPSNGGIINDSTPYFDWDFSDIDGTQAGFQVLIDDDINFLSVDYDSGDQDSSNSNWQFPDGTGYTEIADGVWYWMVRTRDDDGDWSPYSLNWSLTLDSIILPPEDISATPGTWTNSNSFTVTWTNPSDLTGIVGAYYKLYSPPTSNSDGTYVGGLGITSIAGITVGGDGAHDIYVWLKDGANNVDYNEFSTTILYFDGTPPSSPIGIGASPASWSTINSFDVTWTNPGEVSGIAGVYYKLYSPPTSDTDGTYIAGADITILPDLSVASEGQHPIYIWLVDNTDNIDYTNNASTFLHYDATPPSSPISLTATPVSWTSTNSFNVDWTNPAEVSGIGGAYYKLYSAPTWDTDGTLVSGAGINSISGITVIGDGAHLICVWLQDNAGNIDYTTYSSTTLYFDGTPPSSPSGLTADPGSWTSTNSFTVDWTNPAEVSGIAGTYYKLYSAPTSDTDGTYVSGSDITSIGGITVSGEGQHAIYVWLQDNADNRDYTTSSSTFLYYDATPPSLPLDVKATPDTWTSTNSFTVTWTNPFEVSGISGAYYKLYSAPTSDTDGTYVAGSDITSISSISVIGEGQHPIYVWLIDNALNIDYNNNNFTYLKFDATPPTSPIGLTPTPSSWTSINSFTVSWANPAEVSGIGGAYYKLDSAPTSNGDGTFVSGPGINSISSISVTGDGIHQIYVWLQDNASNQDYTTYVSTDLYYDGSAPASPIGLSANPSTWTSTNSFSVSWFNPAEVSGIAGAYYKLDSAPTSDTDGTYIAGSDITSISSITVGSDGQHLIYVWLQDNADNADYTSSSTTFLYYDGSAPSLPLGLSAIPSTWTSTNSFSVSWTNPSELSGIAGAYYKLDSPPTAGDDGTYMAGSDITSINNIVVSGDGAHTIYIWLRDEAGNVDHNNYNTTILYYDGTPPSLPLGVTAIPSSWAPTNLFTVFWTNPSEVSGIAGAYYKLDSPPTAGNDGTYVAGSDITIINNIVVTGEGAHTIYIWLMDETGNVDHNNNNITTLYYDGTPPTSPSDVTATPISWTNTNSFTVSWINPAEVSGIAGVYYKLYSPPTSDTDGTLVSGSDINSINGITVSGDGQHPIYIWLIDEAGNLDYMTYGTTDLFYDSVAPGLPIGLTVDPSTWTSTNSFNVSWANPMDLSGIGGAYYKLDSPPTSDTDGTLVTGPGINSIDSISVLGDGTHTVYVWLVDNASNIDYNNYASTTLYYDGSAPSLPTNVITDPNTWSTINSFNVSWINPSDLSGIAGVYYKLDSPPTFDDDGTYAAGAGIDNLTDIIVAGDGAHTIYIWLKDIAGGVDYLNYNTTILYYDGPAPSAPLNLTATPDIWTSINSFDLSWDNPFEASGIAGVYYKLDSPPTFNTDGVYTAGVDIISLSGLTVSGDGAHPIYIWLENGAGNVDYNNTNMTFLYFDSTPPSSPEDVTADPISWTNSNSYTVSWINPIDLSGIAGAYYKLDSPPTSDSDGTFVAGFGITSISSITVLGEGQHTVYVWLIDNVSNVDYTTYNTTILYFDSTAPSSPTGVGATPSTWTATNSFTVSWTNPADMSGIGGAYYKLDSPPTSDTDGTLVTGSDINSISSITVTGDGTHTIYIWLQDNAANIDYNNYGTTTLYYDGSAPSQPISVTANPSTWTATNSFSVSWTNPTEHSGIAGAYYKLDAPPTSDTDGIYVDGPGLIFIGGISVSGDGQHPVYIWLIDEVGNIDYNNNGTTSLYYDSTAPPSPTGVTATPSTWTGTNSFTASWTNPSDLSGIGGAYYRLDSAPAFDTDGTYVAGSDITSISNIIVSGDGQHTVYIWLEDAVGNIDYNNYSTTIFYYDGTAPSSPTSVTANPSTWTSTNSFTASWTNPSDLSGIAGAYYKLDSVPTSDTDGTYVSGSDITSITNIIVSGDGQHTVYIWLEDAVGNIDHNNRDSATLYYDSSAPAKPINVVADPNTWTSTNSFLVSWTNPSELSGIDGVYYKLDMVPSSDTDGTLVSGSDITFISNIVVSGDGQHSIYIWLIDKAGNIDYNNRESTILYYDATAPLAPVNVEANPSTWTSTNLFTVSWTNPNEFSGIGGAYYRLDSAPTSDIDGTYVAGNDITSIDSITVTGDGQHTVYIWLKDKAGNIDYNNYASTTLYYDGSAPAPPMDVTANPDVWTSVNSFSVSWTNPSDLSGIIGAYYKLDNAPASNTDGNYVSGAGITSISNIFVSGDGQQTIYIWLKDGVDNLNYNNHNTTILYYDGSAPQAPTGLSVNPNTWTSTNSFTIDWTEPSDYSGIKTGAYYSVGTSPPSSSSVGTWTSDKPFNITSAPEGSSYVYLWLEDNVGNKNHLNYGSIVLKLDTTAPTIQHTHVTAGTINNPIVIEAEVLDTHTGINNVLLFWKKKSSGLYMSEIMDSIDDTYYTEITADTTETLEYYIKATDKSTPPNIAYYSLFGQVTTQPDSTNDIDITISGSDIVPPEISTNSPSESSINVPVGTTITLSFSEPMNLSSVENAFSLKDSGGDSVAGGYSWNGNSLTFTPDTRLYPQTQYTVRLDATARDLSGNPLQSDFTSQFTTGTDPTQPTVVEKTPEGSDVSTGSVITIRFSKAMNKTAAENAFLISPAVSGRYEWEGNTLKFIPDELLDLDTQYTVTLDSSAKDLDGNNIPGLSWQFTTKSDEDVTLPTVLDYSPEGSEVSVNAEISIIFSVFMEDRDTKNAFSIVSSDASDAAIVGVFQWDRYTLKFKPDPRLEYDTMYTVRMNTTAKGIDGRYLDKDVEWQFITEAAPKKTEPAGLGDWDFWEPIVTGLTILATFLLALFGFVRLRKKRNKLRDYLEQIDHTFNEYNENVQICEQELITLRDAIKKEVAGGKLEEAHFLILDKKIDDYLKDMRTSGKRMGTQVNNKMTPLEEFVEELEEELEKEVGEG